MENFPSNTKKRKQKKALYSRKPNIHLSGELFQSFCSDCVNEGAWIFFFNDRKKALTVGNQNPEN